MIKSNLRWDLSEDGWGPQNFCRDADEEVVFDVEHQCEKWSKWFFMSLAIDGNFTSLRFNDEG